jgi:ATP-dependent Clp protease protease subunit
MNEIINNPQPLQRDLFLSGEIDENSVKAIIIELIKINNHDRYLSKFMDLSDSCYTPKPIKIYIDSPGGDVRSGLGLCDIIRRSETPIHTIVLGNALSMGFVIALCGHKRFGHLNSTFMYHQLSYMNWWLSLKGHEERLDLAKELQARLDRIVIENSKLSQKKLDKVNNQKKDWFISSDEALKFKIIDEIL